ncbi:heme peroxidase [Antrihabitans sp. YC2-6]|uniref:heme peroxidase n=1 Tax=Antrihabitans sp. YC2-6 TaxID=2799498 RepID=UPI0018F63883|nr:heme peroxidase [Antrihabitans sp. YC2-6]MBJ8345567.1 heme peroxidase [Antrihabitans sp. YC2-6]
MINVVDRADVLAASCIADLGDPAFWVAPDELRNSLALAVIESIQATRSHYTSVRNVLTRYDEYRRGASAADGAGELRASFNELGGPENWADRIGNRKPTSTQAGSPLKAAAIFEAAQLLHGRRIEHGADLRAIDDAGLTDMRSAWLSLPGQASGLTWTYLSMHLGHTPPGADPLVTRYVAVVLDVPERELDPDAVAALIGQTATQLDLTPRPLEYAIWRCVSGRPVLRPDL